MHNFNIGYSVMGCLLYLAIVGIQLSSTWAGGTVPMTCFLQNQNYFNIFGRGIGNGDGLTSAASTNPSQLDTIRVNEINLIETDWAHNTTDIEFRGINDAVIDEFGVNFNTNNLHITFHTDILFKANYRSSGTIFSLPIAGEGSCTVYFNNILFGIIMPFNIVEENGQQFINLISFDYFYDVQDSANITLTNLYYGDTESSTRMHRLMNSNWKYMTERYSPIFIDAAADIIFNTFRNNMRVVPLKRQNIC